MDEMKERGRKQETKEGNWKWKETKIRPSLKIWMAWKRREEREDEK